MRVHVVKRPRMESTSTSSMARCFAASGWRAFQRSRPSIASFLCAAFAMTMSGIDDFRFEVPFMREGATRGASFACFG